jgi:hypothetical protein
MASMQFKTSTSCAAAQPATDECELQLRCYSTGVMPVFRALSDSQPPVPHIKLHIWQQGYGWQRKVQQCQYALRQRGSQSCCSSNDVAWKQDQFCAHPDCEPAGSPLLAVATYADARRCAILDSINTTDCTVTKETSPYIVLLACSPNRGANCNGFVSPRHLQHQRASNLKQPCVLCKDASRT